MLPKCQARFCALYKRELSCKYWILSLEGNGEIKTCSLVQLKVLQLGFNFMIVPHELSSLPFCTSTWPHFHAFVPARVSEARQSLMDSWNLPDWRAEIEGQVSLSLQG